MIIKFISLCRRRKQRLCKDGKTKKGERRETCQMRLAIFSGFFNWRGKHILVRNYPVIKLWHFETYHKLGMSGF